ncbi:MAG: protease modulator HflC [Rhodomicrobiaceae bacterium]
MRNAIFVFLLIVLGAAAFIAYNAVFIVHQTQTALVLEFGNPKKVLTTPGLNFKIPFIQTVEFFDKRILDIDLPSKEVIVADQKRLVVDAFARYKIVDPLLFFQSVTNELGAHNRIDSILDAVMRSTLGGSDFFEVVKTKRADLMHDIAKRVDNEAKSFGIQVVDVRLRRVDLPEANSQAIYERMKTERQREAAEIRAQGTEASKRIRGNGDRQVTVITADANRDAERIRGDGDAERNRIYAEAFSKDPEFFAFYRSMQAYEEGLKSADTRLVISPTSEFFDYFNNPDGKAAAKPGKPNAAPSPTSAPASQAAR